MIGWNLSSLFSANQMWNVSNQLWFARMCFPALTSICMDLFYFALWMVGFVVLVFYDWSMLLLRMWPIKMSLKSCVMTFAYKLFLSCIFIDGCCLYLHSLVRERFTVLPTTVPYGDNAIWKGKRQIKRRLITFSEIKVNIIDISSAIWLITDCYGRTKAEFKG